MGNKRGRIRGRSYADRMQRVLEIYNAHVNDGLSTREILRRYIHPEFPISESTLYNYFNKEFEQMENPESEGPTLFPDYPDESNTNK